MDLNHFKHDLPLHQQLENLYSSTKESINYMDESRNKEYSAISLETKKTNQCQP